MTMYLANDRKILGQCASNYGYTLLIQAVEADGSLTQLDKFLETGLTENIDGVISDLERFASSIRRKQPNGGKDLQSTALGMADLMRGQKFVGVTQGFRPEKPKGEAQVAIRGQQIVAITNGMVPGDQPGNLKIERNSERHSYAGGRLNMTRGLLIRHPWIDMILDGQKTWEIRGSRTAIRGTIGLIAAGSGTITGVCEVVDCHGPLSANMFRKNAAKAGIRPSEVLLGHYRNTYAWVLANPTRLKKPVRYEHPSGAVIWVSLDGKIAQAIRRQLTR